MKTKELDIRPYIAGNKPELVLAQADITLTETHYRLHIITHITGRGKDQYGRYQTTKETVELVQYSDEEEIMDMMEGIQTSANTEVKTIVSGKIPEQLIDKEQKAVETL